MPDARTRTCSLLAVLLASGVLLGACSAATPKTVDSPPASSSASASPSLGTSVPPATGPADWYPARGVVLAGPIEGEEDAVIPDIRPAAGSFVIYFVCAGGGAFSITVEPSKKIRYPCDDIPNSSQVLVDKDISSDLSVDVEGNAQWRLAVLDGEPS